MPAPMMAIFMAVSVQIFVAVYNNFSGWPDRVHQGNP